MLATCGPVNTHSKFTNFTSRNTHHDDEGGGLLTLTSSLLKDESLCAWNSDLFKEDGYFHNKQNSKKLAMLKASVIGLNVKKTNSNSNTKKHSRHNLHNLHPKDENNNNRSECSFVHYTDSRQYVEEYRKNKLSRMKKELENEESGDPCGRDNSEGCGNRGSSPSALYSKVIGGCEFRRNYPVVSLQSYDYLTLGYRFDESQKGKSSIKDIQSELKRDMLSCMQIRRGKCTDQHESDSATTSNIKPAVATTKQMSICNISAHDNICSTEKTFIRSRDLRPEASLQCKKIMDKPKNEGHKNLTVKTPHLMKTIKVRSAEQRRNRHVPMNSNEYCHIIKRVLGHCDTSRLSFHGMKESDGNPSSLITTS